MIIIAITTLKWIQRHMNTSTHAFLSLKSSFDVVRHPCDYHPRTLADIMGTTKLGLSENWAYRLSYTVRSLWIFMDLYGSLWNMA